MTHLEDTPCNDEPVPAPTRVLLVVAHGGAGGMQVQVGTVARGLADAGCEVTVAAGPGAIQTHGVELVELPELSARSAVAFARALRSAIARSRPEVVHGHGLRLAPMLAASARGRSLVTCHGIDPKRAGRTAALTRLTRVPVASCGEGPRGVLARSGLGSRILNNAVPPMPAPLARTEIAARFGLDADAMLVVSPARLSPQKDPLTLVRALAYARGAAVVLIGGGPLEPEVRAEVARLGLGGRVVITPWLDDARAVLAGADALALASVWEGQPTVVLEAMAAGVVVVATRATGTADTVVDGVTGLLSDVGDPAALGASLESAAGPALRERLTAAARLQADEHRVEVVVAEHLSAYRRVLAGAWAA